MPMGPPITARSGRRILAYSCSKIFGPDAARTIRGRSTGKTREVTVKRILRCSGHLWLQEHNVAEDSAKVRHTPMLDSVFEPTGENIPRTPPEMPELTSAIKLRKPARRRQTFLGHRLPAPGSKLHALSGNISCLSRCYLFSATIGAQPLSLLYLKVKAYFRKLVITTVATSQA